MRRALLLLVLVGVMVGAAVAEAPREDEEVEVKVEDEEEGGVEGKQLASLAAFEALKLAKKGLLGTLFKVATQIVVLIALVLLISTLKKNTSAIFGGGEDYEYYHVPAAYPSASSSGSSYSSGYSKRSADDLPASNAFMDLPVVQRLTERVNSAIENFNA